VLGDVVVAEDGVLRLEQHGGGLTEEGHVLLVGRIEGVDQRGVRDARLPVDAQESRDVVHAPDHVLIRLLLLGAEEPGTAVQHDAGRGHSGHERDLFVPALHGQCLT
jgi:hypothetical protein